MQEWQERIEQQFEQFKTEMRAELRAKLIEEMRRIREHQTEPIPAVNVNVASQDVITRLDKLDQDLNTHSETWLNTLQEHYDEHTKHFEKIESTMTTKQDLTTLKTAQDAHFDQIEAEQKQQHEMLRQILRLLGQKPPES